MIYVFLIILTLAVALLYLRYRLHRTPDNGDLEAALEQEIHKLTRKGLTGGLIVGVYKQGKTWAKGYGSVSTQNPRPPDAEAIFQIGSISKVLTTTTLQRLCDQGQLTLDTTLETLLDDSHSLDPRVKTLTLRQLATHTAGFPRVPKPLLTKLEARVGKDQLMENPYSHLGVPEILAYLQNPVGLRKPGQFAYSNYGVGLLGHLLEKVTGTPLDTLVKETLLLPLNMPHTSIDLPPVMQERLVQGYDGQGKPASLWTFAALGGAGAFHSCAADMLSFIRANLDGNHPLTPLLKRTHIRQGSGKTGIGWIQASLLDRFVGNASIAWHDGQVGGYSAYLALDPQTNTGVVVLSAQSVDRNMLGMMLMRLLRTQSWRPSRQGA
ncbi:serine hydrolase domain-containing protein [Thiothrix lacustris]|uniref:Serine hydrolase domain-containing protein n=1 Tax=Thiothrix lacustris TaxID=525917 RepID=A0ABY9MSH4_9GAMM|nr:serine hydrolase domain-containing protein [Thiothrix lacustris]WML91601.1 serine hydrolase domain-containing protein [Thiothrix lacustris]